MANEIYNNCINGFLADKTRILITHRIKHLETAHNIVLLENGKVVDQGNWNDLVENGNHVFLKKLKQDRESEGLPFLLIKHFAQFIADESVYLGSYDEESKFSVFLKRTRFFKFNIMLIL